MACLSLFLSFFSFSSFSFFYFFERGSGVSPDFGLSQGAAPLVEIHQRLVGTQLEQNVHILPILPTHRRKKKTNKKKTKKTPKKQRKQESE